MTIEKYLPKVLEFFLRSTTTSRILPWVTVIIFAWDFWVCICKPLKTFFFEYDITSNKNELFKSFEKGLLTYNDYNTNSLEKITDFYNAKEETLYIRNI